MSQIVDITGESICRELKALFPQASRSLENKKVSKSSAFALAN
jgi:hypothetical protein